MKKLILLLLIPTLLVGILLYQIDPKEIIRVTAKASIVYVLLSFVLNVASILMRTIRFKFFVKDRIDTRNLFAILCVHNSCLYFIPARIGELSFLYLTKKLGNFPFYKGATAILLVRVIEIWIISVLFLLAIATMGSYLQQFTTLSYVAYCAVAIVVLGSVSLFSPSKGMFPFIRRLVQSFRNSRLCEFKFISTALEKSLQLTDEVERALNEKELMYRLFLVSVVIWLLDFLSRFSLLIAMHIDLTLFQYFFLSLLLRIMATFPIHGFGGFGTFDASMSILLIFFGITKTEAISKAFGMHLIIICLTAILGIYGIIGLLLWLRKNQIPVKQSIEAH